MTGGHWAPGIVVMWRPMIHLVDEVIPPRWRGFLDFLSDDPGTEEINVDGSLCARREVPDGHEVDVLTALLDALIADATRMGIRLGSPDGDPPRLGFVRVAEPPAGYVDLLAAQVERLGWAGPEPTDRETFVPYPWRAS